MAWLKKKSRKSNSRSSSSATTTIPKQVYFYPFVSNRRRCFAFVMRPFFFFRLFLFLSNGCKTLPLPSFLPLPVRASSFLPCRGGLYSFGLEQGFLRWAFPFLGCLVAKRCSLRFYSRSYVSARYRPENFHDSSSPKEEILLICLVFLSPPKDKQEGPQVLIKTTSFSSST